MTAFEEKMLKKLLLKFKSLILKTRCFVLELQLNKLIDEGGGRITIRNPNIKISILKSPSANFIVRGNLSFVSWLNGLEPIFISIGKNSRFEINGDFEIGNGVQILVHQGASLTIGGRKNESASGITCNTKILTYRKIAIGVDFICAWNVFISDSDWHQIIGRPNHLDVTIGNHVWIAHGCSILKGAHIGNNSIIGCHSIVSLSEDSPNCLIAGSPAKVVRTNISWKRDMGVQSYEQDATPLYP